MFLHLWKLMPLLINFKILIVFYCSLKFWQTLNCDFDKLQHWSFFFLLNPANQIYLAIKFSNTKLLLRGNKSYCTLPTLPKSLLSSPEVTTIKSLPCPSRPLSIHLCTNTFILNQKKRGSDRMIRYDLFLIFRCVEELSWLFYDCHSPSVDALSFI